MDFQQMIENLTPAMVAQIRRAVELGRWPDGRRLTDEQRGLCLQAVIAWDARHLEADERVGYIDRGSKAAGASCDSPQDGAGQDRQSDSPDRLRWLH